MAALEHCERRYQTRQPPVAGKTVIFLLQNDESRAEDGAAERIT